MENNNRKTYSYFPLPEETVVYQDYSEMMEGRLISAPDVPVFSYTDYKTKEIHKIMPGEYWKWCRTLGSWMRKEGMASEHIGLMGDNSWEWVCAYQAILCSSNVAVLLDKALEEAKLDEFIADSDCRVILYSKAYEEKAGSLAEKHGLKLYSIEELVRKAEEIAASAEADTYIELPPVDPDAPAILTFTSGTTGRSKVVVLSQRNIVYNSVCIREQIVIPADMVHLLPLHHTYGLNVINMSIMNGKTMHINGNLRHMYADFMATDPDMILMVPLMIEGLLARINTMIAESGKEEEVREKLCQVHENDQLTLADKREIFRDQIKLLGSRVSTICSGGAFLEESLVSQLRDLGFDMRQGYGISECSPFLSVELQGSTKLGTVGRSLVGTEIMIDKPDKNMIGEVCVRGKNIMLEYYKNPKATEEAIIDGWFHTGDMGYLDEDDHICLTGRIKNLIILANGENVSPEEIELKLLAEPAIQEVVVYDRQGKIGAQVFMNMDHLEKEKITDGQAYVREYIRSYNKTVPAFKNIAFVEFRDIPFERTSTQKIKRESILK